MKFLKFEREARLLGPGKEPIFPLTRLCTPITPQATQAHNKKDCWHLFFKNEISIIIIFFEIEKAEWWKIITRTLWKNNKEKRGPASSSRWNR